MSAPAVPRERGSASVAGRVRGHPWLVAVIGGALLIAVLVAGVGLGTVQIGPLDAIGVVLWRTIGLDVGASFTPATETIIWELRLPRVLTAMVIGAGLAVAGATFQGLLRNPLADPFVLGTASGAALGAAIAILLPVNVVFVAFGLLHGLAFAGALLAAFVVFRLGGSGGPGGLTRLLLTGYAIASILTALLTMAMYVSGSDLRQIFAFLLGGLAGSSWARLAVAAPLIAASCGLILLRARSLDGMLLGDAAARHLGVDVGRERGILLALASMATAAGVAISGLIGFVGLVVPHLVRLVVGPAARRVLPLSAIVGAWLLAAADLVARLVGDVPVGVVMALLGAPFFLFLLQRTRTGYEL
ncbi:MAG: iron ABC transporter permease [Candidatus Limnocylindrales bacterium]